LVYFKIDFKDNKIVLKKRMLEKFEEFEV